jgi:hypothetical protein
VYVLIKVHKKGKEKFASTNDMKAYRWSRGFFFFFFFFLGPVCISSGCTSAFEAYCAHPNLLIAQVHYPRVSYKETEVPN